MRTRSLVRRRRDRSRTFAAGETSGTEDAFLGLDPSTAETLAASYGGAYADGYVHGFRSVCPDWDPASGRHPSRTRARDDRAVEDQADP